MGKFRNRLARAFLAHVVASYSTYGFGMLFDFVNIHDIHGIGWLYLCLAPIFTPIVLIVFSASEFPHYGAADYGTTIAKMWLSYAIPFFLVYLLGRKKVRVWPDGLTPLMPAVIVELLTLYNRPPPAPPWQSVLEGKPAPQFTLADLNGTNHSIADERGHVILLDFWGIECPPCLVELKTSIAVLAGDETLSRKGLRVWTINDWDNAPAIKGFLKDNGYHFTVLVDDKNQIADMYEQGGLPTTYLIGRDGNVKEAFAGFNESVGKEMRQQIIDAMK